MARLYRGRVGVPIGPRRTADAAPRTLLSERRLFLRHSVCHLFSGVQIILVEFVLAEFIPAGWSLRRVCVSGSSGDWFPLGRCFRLF